MEVDSWLLGVVDALAVFRPSQNAVIQIPVLTTSGDCLLLLSLLLLLKSGCGGLRDLCVTEISL